MFEFGDNEYKDDYREKKIKFIETATLKDIQNFTVEYQVGFIKLIEFPFKYWIKFKAKKNIKEAEIIKEVLR